MPTAAEVLRQARARAGLSQRELARRAGTAQSVIARIERGQTSPTWATLQRLLAAAGTSSAPASDLLADVSHMLSLTPEQRLAGVRNLSAFFAAARRIDSAAGKRVSEGPVSIPIDPERIFRTLARHKVRFVLIGALAAGLQGFPRASYDADITPAQDPENLQRLAAALRDLEARIFTAQIPEGLLAGGEIWNLITAAGRLDIAFRPSGTTGYDDLAQQAIHLTVYGDTLLAARLEDIIRSKEAADRPKDRQDVVVMREMLKKR